MNTRQDPNQARVLVAIIVAVAGAGAGFFILMAGSSSAQVEATAPRAAIQQAQPVSMPAPVPQPSAPSSEPIVEPIADGPTPTSEPPSTASRLARDLEREKIWAALRREHDLEPAAPGSAAPTESEAAKLPEIKPEYVREAIREQLMPIALECYNTALRQDPKLGGQITVKFTIIGEEEIGGVVESAEIDGEETTLDSEFLRECMRESVMAVTFDPPPNSGRVDITYPFIFSPD